MKQVVVITPADAYNGFACCGVRHLVAGPGDVAPLMASVVAEPDVGVVILDERLLVGIDEEYLLGWEQHWSGVVVVLPAPSRLAEREGYVTRLIQRAVGYQVRIGQ